MNRMLANRVVLLVGVGAAGDTLSNGRATALAFAEAGAQLVLADRDEVALQACLDAIAARGGHARAVRTDATQEGQVQQLIQSCMQQEGRIDVLHNNIGIAYPGRLKRVSAEDVDRCLAINIKSIILLCKHTLPQMEKQGSGAVTNISSISSIRHLGISSPLYDVSKAGLNALTRHIAVEWGPKGIRANTILVGMMDTPLAREGIAHANRDVDEVYATYIERIPSRRMGVAADTANLAVFLASNAASYINGVEIAVDGGLTARSG